MLCVVSEDTERVIGERRLATLRDLGAGIAGARTEAEVLAAARAHLGSRPDVAAVRARLPLRRRTARGWRRPAGSTRRIRRPSRLADRRRARARRRLRSPTCRPAPGTAAARRRSCSRSASSSASSSPGSTPLRPLDEGYRELPRPVAGPARRRPHQRARLRGGAPPRRDAARARRGQDRVLHQRQPRAADAADAAARPGRGRADRRRGPAVRRSARARRAHPPQRPAAAEARQHAAGLLAPAVRAAERGVRPDRPRALHGRAREHVRVGRRPRRPGADDRLPAARRSRSTSTPRCGPRSS